MTTDVTIPNNKPYIIIRNNEQGTCLFIDIAISGVTFVVKKEPQNILKFKDLTVEKQRMRNLKTKVIPVVIWTTGIISKSLIKYINNIPGNN